MGHLTASLDDANHLTCPQCYGATYPVSTCPRCGTQTVGTPDGRWRCARSHRHVYEGRMCPRCPVPGPDRRLLPADRRRRLRGRPGRRAATRAASQPRRLPCDPASPWGEADAGRGLCRRGRRDRPVLHACAPGLLGRADPTPPGVRHHDAPRIHHQAGLHAGPLGRDRGGAEDPRQCWLVDLTRRVRSRPPITVSGTSCAEPPRWDLRRWDRLAGPVKRRRGRWRYIGQERSRD